MQYTDGPDDSNEYTLTCENAVNFRRSCIEPASVRCVWHDEWHCRKHELECAREYAAEVEYEAREQAETIRLENRGV